MTPGERHREHLVELTRGQPECVGRAWASATCDGKLDADHVIEARWITQAYRQAQVAARTRGRPSPLLEHDLDDLLADGRNGMWLCNGHNRWKAQAMFKIPEPYMPPTAWDFAVELGLEDLYYRVVLDEAVA